jgi:hypothetical protein
VRVDEKVAVGFVVDNLQQQSLTAFLDEPRLREFVRLVRAGQEIAAAKEYETVTGAKLAQCHFAVLVAQRFFG